MKLSKTFLMLFGVICAALCLGTSDISAQSTSSGPAYKIIDLGRGWQQINDMTETSLNGGGVLVVGQKDGKAYLWQDGNLVNLHERLGGGASDTSVATGVGAGVVGNLYGFGAVTGFWFINGGMMKFPDAELYDVNYQGEMVGSGSFRDPFNPYDWIDGGVFLSSDFSNRLIPTLLPTISDDTFSYTTANALKTDLLGNHAEFVGEADNRAVYGDAREGRIQALGTLGGSRSAALNVNQKNQIVGWSYDANMNAKLPCLWQSPGSAPMNLGRVLSPYSNSSAGTGVAYDINNYGQAVGGGLIYEVGQPGQLNLSDMRGVVIDDILPPNSGWQSLSAACINDAGIIAGIGSVAGDSQRHGFLLVPTFEPSRPPSAPSRLIKESIGYSRLRLTWTDSSDNESWFEVERSTDNGSFVPFKAAPANATSIEVTDYSSNSRYRIRAVNKLGFSAYTIESAGATPTPTPDTRLPVLTSPQVTPSRLPSTGGKVALRVSATDDVGVATAQVEVLLPSGGKQTFDLRRTIGSATAGTWETSLNVPPNTTKKTRIYRLTFLAKDAAGNSARSTTVTFTVDKRARR